MDRELKYNAPYQLTTTEDQKMSIEELRQLMLELDPEKQEITDDVLVWFMCIQRAHEIADESIKDLAHLFLNGVEVTTLSTLEQWLVQIVDDLGSQEEANQHVVDMVKLFFGIKD